MAQATVKIVHVINCLDTGGAETMLLRLLGAVDSARFESEVVSLTTLGEIADALRGINVPVSALGMRRGSKLPNPYAIVKLARKLAASKPDVVQTWMYHSNLLGGIAAKLSGTGPVIWGIRQTNLDTSSVGAATRGVARIGARLSSTLADKIVFNSDVSRRAHTAFGYDGTSAITIPNGFDLDRFKPDKAARVSVREELGLPADSLLIGKIARFDVQKDHHNFLAAAKKVTAAHPRVAFLLCGLGVDAGNATLAQWIEELDLETSVHLLGHRRDLPRLCAALDVGCLSSMGEGFPNVVGEVMACGTPCVVTDVGDAGFLVGEAGRVVIPRDADALAGALIDLIDMPSDARTELGGQARERVGQLFSLDHVAGRYEAVWTSLLNAKQHPVGIGGC